MALDYGNGGSLNVRMAGPFSSGENTPVKLTEISLPAGSWKGAESPWSQTVAVDDVSVNSKIDLLASPEQIEALREKNLAFLAENDGGTVTVYCIGEKPGVDYTFPATVTEVLA